jgi:uncharacterized integral membrane protein
MMNVLVAILGFLFFIVLVVVGVYNGGEVTINLLLWQIGPVPLGAAIAAAAVFGTAFACTIGVIDGIKIRFANRQLRRQLERLEEEADALRLRLARPETPAPIPPSGPFTGEPRGRA